MFKMNKSLIMSVVTTLAVIAAVKKVGVLAPLKNIIGL